jgi:hypothetical protein
MHFVNVPPVVHPTIVQIRGPATADLLAERSMYASSPLFVREKGSPLVNRLLRDIEERYDYAISQAQREGLAAVLDVRVHRLFPGQYPGIPGWHCDFVPRGSYSGQPNFSLCHPRAFHIALLLSDQPHGVSSTRFVDQPIRPDLYDKEHVYRNLHHEVHRINPPIRTIKDGELVWFNQKTIHAASPCHRRGVRMFLRYSMIEKPVVANQFADQQQVYLLSEENGW